MLSLHYLLCLYILVAVSAFDASLFDVDILHPLPTDDSVGPKTSHRLEPFQAKFLQILSHHPISDWLPLASCCVGIDAVPARESGVLEFHIPRKDVDVSFAQELGVHYFAQELGVYYFAQELGVHYFAQELGVHYFAQEPGICYSVANGVPFVPSIYDSKVSATISCGAALDVCGISNTYVLSCTIKYADDVYNLGLVMVTFVLDFLSYVCQFFQFMWYGMLLLFRLTLALIPHGEWWPPHLCRVSFMVISCWMASPDTVLGKCRRLKVLLLRCMFRRGDFLFLWNSIRKVRPFTVIFLLAFHLMSRWTMATIPSIEFGIHKNVSSIYVPPLVQIGGGRIALFSLEELLPHVDHSGKAVKPFSNLKFVGHRHKNVAGALYKELDDHVFGQVPMGVFLAKLTQKDAKSIAKMHRVHVRSKATSTEILTLFEGHWCACCDDFVSVFQLHSSKSDSERSKLRYARLDDTLKKKRQEHDRRNERSESSKRKKAAKRKETTSDKGLKHHEFPPSPPSKPLRESIVRGWYEDTSPEVFMEGGCAVCGQLIPLSRLSKLSESECNLDVLARDGLGVTRLERFTPNDPIQEIKGPVLDNTCTKICCSCKGSLDEGVSPKYALANGLWLGQVPPQLQDLSYAEQLLVSRVRRNKCLVKVSSGMHKMKANVIAFENPMPKIYQRLPPPVEDLDEVLAFVYTGPCRPSPEEMERTPLLVRRTKVSHALEWLKLNHADYHDMDIAYDNLKAYPECGSPFIYTYKDATANKTPEAASAFDNETEEGVDSGPCPFVVNGITGEQLNKLGTKALVAKAVKHLKEDNGHILAIGHAEKPESMYDNPQLYPMMFPWLFPYGLGGVGAADELGMSNLMHKRKLLMYHDKRFQLDSHFPLIAFNQEQIKSSTTGGYLMAERQNFDDIAERLMNVDIGALEDLSSRLAKGERVKAVTEEEKTCYKLISDLDHVAGHVQGSLTSKRYMRNEIWSLISYLGAPSWFITFAPADNNHPISLYYADTKETFSPKIRDGNERYRLIARNPVAGARFFHFVVQMFIKHVLGVDQVHPGLYGNTSAYYGTVEQQGRLTLHLHLLLWISGALTPQEIRDRIMDVNSDFQKKLVEYLESVCVGEFLTGPKIDVSERVGVASQASDYLEPTFTLPTPPPRPCGDQCGDCSCEKDQELWWQEFESTVDDVLLRSNQHTHKFDKNGNNISYCMTAKGECKRRFPRDTFLQTLVDPKSGALSLKKGEAWMNSVTPLLSYLLRSNSDVTSLLSGTAIKAVVAYVSDYITKPSLKTYIIFDVIRSVFDRNSEMIGGDLTRREKTRKIITQVVNSLTSKMEIGGPMASLYLLGNPDHYTGHKFVPFYWRGYVNEVLCAWEDEEVKNDTPDLGGPEKVVVNKNQGRIIGLSKVSDYVHRPSIYKNKTLYNWIRLYKKSPKRRVKKKKVGDAADCPEYADSDDELNIQPLALECSDVVKNDDVHYIDDTPLEDFIEDDTGPGDDYEDVESLDVVKDDDVHYIDDTFDGFIEDDMGYGDNDEVEEVDEGDELDIMQELAEDIVKKPDRSFQEGHPQCATHQAHMSRNNSLIIPNFLPDALPRSDRGDREYYCCTMLTLFKPWRNGKDLKGEHSSWDKAFVAHEFTRRQKEIMKYFDVRYECLDARDDYSAKRAKGDNGISYQWATPDLLDELDQLHEAELGMAGADFGASSEYDDDISGIVGRKGKHRLNEMLTAERTMKTAGWLDACEDGLPDVGPLDPVRPEVNQPSKAWRAAVLARKQAVIEERNKHIPTNTASKPTNFKPNQVEVVDKSYIDHLFNPTSKRDDHLITDTIEKFILNSEQQRAFRIIANHSVMDRPDQLKMYLGGMGGTGKSQVIKALMHFFGERKENHRFSVVAPTGSAAALLNGSTYHSVLGINDGERVSAASLAQIRARLDGVDYIFLDEVSMISCRDMYKISAQAAKARGVYDEPFGGINFIFAGDFAQLPPARTGAALYSGDVGTTVDAGKSIDRQEAAIGKALWHQITTVVILHQNMRQAQQTPEDAKLRTALENMRYKSCTPDDISFLRTRIAGRGPNDPKLAQKRFRNVSVITARNAQKDRINELGVERFAAENNQTLHSFYSMDRWRNPDMKRQKGARRQTKGNMVDPIRKTNVLSPQLQRALWEQPPASCDKHIAGKLTLCVGLPVMIRHNEATECCITKGAEATVVNWQTIKGPEGQQMLDTLFVKLKDPPKTVKIDGLPDNIVPLTRHSTAVTCVMPNDDEIPLTRDQVLVLPNFGMTDYASQGRTRPDNVVDLNSCYNHQSYYTCLSRSATAAGTIIVQGFNPKIVTGGASGYLRQEFRELEILDEITTLRYNNNLPDCITGERRNIVIRQFQEWKGVDYVPKNVHTSIRWSKQDPMDKLSVTTDTPWQIVKNVRSNKKYVAGSKSDSTGFITAKGSIPVSHVPKIEKRRLDDNEDVQQSVKKFKVKDNIPEDLGSLEEPDGPRGFIWDSENYSCAYDSVMTILLSVWSEDPTKWKMRFKDMNRIMNVLASGFYKADSGLLSLEAARNKVRHLLHQRDPTLFPYGQLGTSVSEMAQSLLRSDYVIAHQWLRCVDCSIENNVNDDLQTCVIQCPTDRYCTISMCLQRKFKDRHPRKKCDHCHGDVDVIMSFNAVPQILAFSSLDTSVQVSKKIRFHDGDSDMVFVLKGIVYHGDFHYTSRVVANGSVWFHDGMVTGRGCDYEKQLDKYRDNELSTCHGKSMSMVFYAQE